MTLRFGSLALVSLAALAAASLASNDARACGGCQLQHWKDEPYLAWKREQVVDALNKRGFGGIQVEPTIAAWGEGRRRAAVPADEGAGPHVRAGRAGRTWLLA